MRAVGMLLALVTAMRAMTTDDAAVQRAAPVLVCLKPGANARIMLTAEATASRIFASIGVELHWKSDARYCGSEESGVVITFEEPDSDRNSIALAYASPYGGRHVVVYLTRTLSFPQLTEQYALRAREFAEAVASLGRHRQIGPVLISLIKEIRRRRSLCFEAAERFERFVQESKPMSDAQKEK